METEKNTLAEQGKRRRKELSNFLKVSGFNGGLDDFAKTFLSTNKDAIYYLYKSNGDLHDYQKQIILDQMKGGKSREHGIRDFALPMLEKILGMKIPRGGDIVAEGDNIAINNSRVSVKNTGGENYEKLFKIAQDEITRLKQELLKAETQRDLYKDMLNEKG